MKKQKKKKIYIPKSGSGGYALLLHMYTKYLQCGQVKFRKEELQRDAQQYSNQSFTDGQGDYYTAWSSMTKLRECLYVRHKQLGSDGWIYRIDDIGKRVAAVIYAQHHGEAVPALPPFTDFDKVALGWKEGDVDNHAEYWNFRGSQNDMQCPYCSKVW